MGKILENISLLHHNTFGIDVKTNYYVELKTVNEIKSFLKSSSSKINPKLILGGGSNILFTKNFEGIVIKSCITGIETIRENDDFTWLRVGSGMEWDSFVKYCTKKNMGGIENLSNIPGTVGASPIQNIGAYGVEVKDFIEEVETIDLNTAEEKTFLNKECNFDYRNSIFKQKYKNKILICSIIFRLTKKHKFVTSYEQIEKELKNCATITLQSIREAVIKIRNNKLPQASEYGNAGSFFKNPSVSKKEALSLKKYFPLMPFYESKNNLVKLSAAWLIVQCISKGKRTGNAGIYKNQPLVIINYGNATGHEILKFAENIQKSVMNKFAIHLEMEVNVV